MTPGTLHALFERLFGDADNVADNAAHPRQVAHLAADLDHGESDTLDVVQLVAYMDGGLDEAKQNDLHARLSQSAAALHDLASADAFLENVATSRDAAPADLVASTIAMSRPAAILPSSPRRSFPIWKWSGVALAVTVAALAVLVIVSRTAPPTDTTQPVTAKSAPIPVAPADGPRLAQPRPRQGGSTPPPVVAEEKTAPTYLAPAASEALMPVQSAPIR
ncbi:conserved protein of unknown function [Magnetospirillum sp. XM-1]|uniref:hypothetical protein n=1 Tax=Magnetospirillum sp. XM-1 TaxID=1663591 RepID=UPI00073DBEFF|nr:hypothetical protein [Magnetospirillum sp. XM-1]CUW41238.1 conserved protein of unknown function [Magnetospirillum sp. XM-1]